jgi:hypothetical protein
MHLLSLVIASQTRPPAWPKGPFGVHAGTPRPLDEYLLLIESVEQALNASAKEIVRRLRRLRWSNFADKKDGGESVDDMIEDTFLNDDDDPPLTTDDVAQAVLNDLFTTSVVQTPSGSSVDLHHVRSSLDLIINGVSDLFDLDEVADIVGVPTPTEEDALAVTSWAGDLQSAWNNWGEERNSQANRNRDMDFAQQLAMLNPIYEDRGKRSRCRKSELLGDIDGQAMAPLLAGTSPGRVSEVVRNYYMAEALPSVDAIALPYPNAVRRFHWFLRNARPAIPFEPISMSPLECALPDQPAAVVSVMNLVEKLAIFVAQGKRFELDGESADPDRVILHQIALDFVGFLQAGLASNDGDASWPPVR